MKKSNEVVLVPFGPTRKIPKGHRWCNSCDGTGLDVLRQGKPCRVCKGKGHWNTQDIRDYHKANPEVCRMSCGKHHIDPYMGAPPDPKEAEKLIRRCKKLVADAKKLLEPFK